MKKLIILLLCCVVLVSMVGCGINTAPPPTESPPTTVSETVITEPPLETIPPVAAVEPTEKEKEPVPTESKDQATEPTVTTTEPTTIQLTEIATTTVPSTAEEKVTLLIEETVESTTPQLTERETTATELPKEESKAETEPPKVSEPEPTEKAVSFDIEYWIAYAKSYAESKGLVLRNTAMDCWDNPIRAGTHCIYLERDIQSRLERYAKDEDITDVWIWTEATGNDCSRTGRCPRNRRSRTTHSKNRIKSNNRKVFTPSGYIPPTNSPLRTSRKSGGIFYTLALLYLNQAV